MSQWTLLWATNLILRIRTAGRRFLTKTTSEPSRQHNSATARTVGSNPDAGAHANVLCSQCPRSKYRRSRSARGRVRARGGPPVWFGPGRSKLVQAFRLRPSQERTTVDNADAFARWSVSLNTWAYDLPWAPHLLSPVAVTDTGEAKAYGK